MAAPIEQQVNGVENMMYMSSQCTNDGMYTLTITFKVGTDLNIAQVLVQNRVSLANPVLPRLVQRRGVLVKKKSPAVLMIINLYSPDGSRSNLDLSNYATIQIRDELARLPGVGDITYLGQRDYSMRLWLDRDKLASRNITASDVINAVAAAERASGGRAKSASRPVPNGQVFQYTMTTLGRLTDADQFGAMVLKTGADGRIVRMRDVARIELGAQGYDQTCTLNGRAVGGSVALSTSRLERPENGRAGAQQDGRTRSGDFPTASTTASSTTPRRSSTNRSTKCKNTLIDAVILVALVVLVFLQNWRSAIIPLVAVPGGDRRHVRRRWRRSASV